MDEPHVETREEEIQDLKKSIKEFQEEIAGRQVVLRLMQNRLDQLQGTEPQEGASVSILLSGEEWGSLVSFLPELDRRSLPAIAREALFNYAAHVKMGRMRENAPESDEV